MFYLSQEVTDFLKEKLEFGDEIVREIQTSYMETIFAIELGEAIFYYEETNDQKVLAELDEWQAKVQNNPIVNLPKFTEYIVKLRANNQELMNRVEDKIADYQIGIFNDTLNALKDEDKEDFRNLVLMGIAKLQDTTERTPKEI